MARILVVDDEAEIAHLFRMLLVNAGHQVDTADSAEAAMACVTDIHYDLIVADMRMPGAGGTALAQFLRAARRSETKIIACTAYYRESLVAHLGFDGFIGKPIDAGAFVSIVEAHLGPSTPPAQPAAPAPASE